MEKQKQERQEAICSFLPSSHFEAEDIFLLQNKRKTKTFYADWTFYQDGSWYSYKLFQKLKLH